MPDISHLIEAALPRVETVRVCLDGVAAAELARMEAELAALEDWQPASLGDADPRSGLSARIEEKRADVARATVEFRFQALGHLAFTRLLAAHPPAAGRQELYDAETFLPALLASGCIEPTLSPGQVEQLLTRVNHGTAEQLFNAALAVNEEPSPLPF